MLIFDPPLQQGVLIKRYKRFLADIELNGEMITAHCPNPGAMTGCAEPGWKVAVSLSENPKRKLPYTLEMVHNGKSWIGVNTQRANTIVEHALSDALIPELRGYSWKREVRYGEKSRIDFLLTPSSDCVSDALCYLEVKSVTLLCNGQNQFPDSVTKRGQQHLLELQQMVKAGHRAILLFVVQRTDGVGFSAASEIDPIYAQMLERARQQGVEIFVRQAQLNPNHWFLEGDLI